MYRQGVRIGTVICHTGQRGFPVHAQIPADRQRQCHIFSKIQFRFRPIRNRQISPASQCLPISGKLIKKVGIRGKEHTLPGDGVGERITDFGKGSAHLGGVIQTDIGYDTHIRPEHFVLGNGLKRRIHRHALHHQNLRVLSRRPPEY